MVTIEQIFGLAKEAAVKLLTENNIQHRVVDEDGKGSMLTMDYVPERLNLSIMAGKVIGVSKG